MVRTLVVLRYDPPLTFRTLGRAGALNRQPSQDVCFSTRFCSRGAEASDESILPDLVAIPYPQLPPLSRDSLLSDRPALPSPEHCRVAHLAAQVAQLPAIAHRAPASAANLISTGLNTTLVSAILYTGAFQKPAPNFDYKIARENHLMPSRSKGRRF